MSLFLLRPPAGASIPLRDLLRVLRSDGAIQTVRDVLAARLGTGSVILFASGREALRVALVALKTVSRRHEIVLPAYCCYSVAAAAVAAGLRIRLVDVGDDLAVDANALAEVPLERCAAVLVGNLFGRAEPLDTIKRLTSSAGVRVIDDGAQALGARDEHGAVGARTEIGILSFGRGKPLSALGGGALVVGDRALEAAIEIPAESSSVSLVDRLSALSLGAAYNLALMPLAFPWISRMPGLHVGETLLEFEFAHGSVRASRLLLLAQSVQRYQALARVRRCTASAVAEEIRKKTDFVPICPADPESGVYPRLAVLASSPDARERALQALRAEGIGASVMYPRALDELADLGAHRIPGAACVRAQRIARTLFTVSTHPTTDPVRVASALLRAL